MSSRGHRPETRGQGLKALMFFFVLAFGLWPLTSHAESIAIAAIVNDSIITTTDFNERRDLVMSMNNMPLTAENQQKITPRIMQALLDETLQMEEAKRYSITITEEEIAKAIATAEETSGQPPGSLLSMIEVRGLAKRSLEAQLRAQLSWSKVVQRKLRRNINVSADETARAQATQAADPGVNEVRIAAMTLPIRKEQDVEKVAALAQKLADEMGGGTAMAAVAVLHAKDDIEAVPPRWVAEGSLPPALQQALRDMKPGEATRPLRTPQSYQLLQLIDRRTSKSLPDTTEVVLKEIRLPMPTTPAKAAIEALHKHTMEARTNPGSCTVDAIGGETTNAEVRFVRTQVSALSPELRAIVSRLGVSEISEPIMTPKAVELIMLCEKIEPASPMLADADKVRQKLFAEKLELEAEKRLRDLKRDAFIEIKGANVAH